MFEALVLATYCILIIGTAFLFLKVRERLQSRREQRAYETLKREQPERVYGTPEYWARFNQPDFAALESHLGRALPVQFRRLYSDSQMVLAKEFAVIPPESDGVHEDWPINCFFPADKQAIIDMWPDEFLNTSYVPFATDGCGGLYYLELEAGTEQDAPVCFYHYDGDIHTEAAESLGEFLSWPRKPDDS